MIYYTSMEFMVGRRWIEAGAMVLSQKTFDRKYLPFNPEDNPGEQRLLHGLMKDWRFRMTAYNFLQIQKNLGPEEQKGLMLFTAFVGLTDDLIDQQTRAEKHPSDSINHVLNSPVKVEGEQVLYGLRGLNIQDLLQLTLAKFGQDKKKVLAEFLRDMIATERKFRFRKPGSYGFGYAQKYRKKTSEAYLAAGAILAGVTDPETIKDLIQSRMVYQFLDDMIDVSDDVRNNSINPVIGMAADSGEVQKLVQCAAGGIPGKGIVNRMRSARSLYAQIPETRNLYKKLWELHLLHIPQAQIRGLFGSAVGYILG